jgi:hypothetical protein
MPQASGDGDLAEKAIAPERGGEIGADDLYGDVSPVLDVTGEVHTRHTAMPQLAAGAVPAAEHFG